MAKILLLGGLGLLTLPLVPLLLLVALLGSGATLPTTPAVPWATWDAVASVRACGAHPARAAAAGLLGLLPAEVGTARWSRRAAKACTAGEGFAPNPKARNQLEVLTLALAYAPGVNQRRVDLLVGVAGAIGTPYRWGGSDPAGYDCSGLVYAFARQVGLSPPRVAQDQFNAGTWPRVPAGQPGDLVFFGSSPRDVGHVGVVVDAGHMVDAPETGAFVRLEEDRWPGTQGVRAIVGMDR